jgi:hypothetical protein
MDMYRIRFDMDDDASLDITDPDVLLQIEEQMKANGNTPPVVEYDTESGLMGLRFAAGGRVEIDVQGFQTLIDPNRLKDRQVMDAKLSFVPISMERHVEDPNQPDSLCPC